MGDQRINPRSRARWVLKLARYHYVLGVSLQGRFMSNGVGQLVILSLEGHMHMTPAQASVRYLCSCDMVSKERYGWYSWASTTDFDVTYESSVLEVFAHIFLHNAFILWLASLMWNWRLHYRGTVPDPGPPPNERYLITNCDAISSCGSFNTVHSLELIVKISNYWGKKLPLCDMKPCFIGLWGFIMCMETLWL